MRTAREVAEEIAARVNEHTASMRRAAIVTEGEKILAREFAAQRADAIDPPRTVHGFPGELQFDRRGNEVVTGGTGKG